MPFGSTSYICQINADAFHLAKQRVRSHAVQSRRLPLRNALLQRRYKSGVFVASAGHSQDLPIKSAQQLRLWTAVDATATIGSIAGALAFFVTSEALLAGIPVILPLLAWYADRRKESLQVEVYNPPDSVAHGRLQVHGTVVHSQYSADQMQPHALQHPAFAAVQCVQNVKLFKLTVDNAGCNSAGSINLAGAEHVSQCSIRQDSKCSAAATKGLTAAAGHGEAYQKHRGKAERSRRLCPDCR